MAATTRQAWTWDTLATAAGPALEQILRTGATPDPQALDGHTYRGWNRGWLIGLVVQKFEKTFHQDDGVQHGHNLVVRQDRKGPGGAWELELRDGRPVPQGYFRVGRTEDEPPRGLAARYRNSVHFAYAVDRNTGMDRPLRVINDYVVLPNPGDHDLVLGKAYLRLGLPVFLCFFVLERLPEA